MSWVQDNFTVVFGIAWVLVAIYMLCALMMAFRLKHVRGRSGQWEGYSGDLTNTLGLLGFMWGGEHRQLADARLSRLVGITRIFFVVAGISVATMFALVFGRMV